MGCRWRLSLRVPRDRGPGASVRKEFSNPDLCRSTAGGQVGLVLNVHPIDRAPECPSS
jgi:hypothetical protein